MCFEFITNFQIQICLLFSFGKAQGPCRPRKRWRQNHAYDERDETGQDSRAETLRRLHGGLRTNALEVDVLPALSSINPSLYTVGPLNLVLDRCPDKELTTVGSILWKEDDACLKWLDSQDHGLVVYTNFGSITVATAKQMTEFAWGLANSRKPFLWVITPDLVVGESAVLPPGVANETADRCMISGRCPQEEVLKRPAVGGKEMKRRAAEWGSAAERATSPGGSSHNNLEKLMSLLLT